MRIEIMKDGLVAKEIIATEEEAERQYPGAWRVAAQQDIPVSVLAVPAKVTRRQGLLALLSHGIKRADIEAKIEAVEDETEREQAWIEYLADTWELNNPRLQSMWTALGGAPEQLDDLFRLAVTL